MKYNLLFPSFTGTIARREYWLSVLLITAINIAIFFLLGRESGSLVIVSALINDITGGLTILLLMSLIPLFGLVFLIFFAGLFTSSILGSVASLWIFYSAIILMGLQIRRLRDINKSALYMLLPFIPIPLANFIGLGYLIYLLSSRSKEKELSGTPENVNHNPQSEQISPVPKTHS